MYCSLGLLISRKRRERDRKERKNYERSINSITSTKIRDAEYSLDATLKLVHTPGIEYTYTHGMVCISTGVHAGRPPRDRRIPRAAQTKAYTDTLYSSPSCLSYSLSFTLSSFSSPSARTSFQDVLPPVTRSYPLLSPPIAPLFFIPPSRFSPLLLLYPFLSSLARIRAPCRSTQTNLHISPVFLFLPFSLSLSLTHSFFCLFFLLSWIATCRTTPGTILHQSHRISRSRYFTRLTLGITFRLCTEHCVFYVYFNADSRNQFFGRRWFNFDLRELTASFSALRKSWRNIGKSRVKLIRFRQILKKVGSNDPNGQAI